MNIRRRTKNIEIGNKYKLLVDFNISLLTLVNGRRHKSRRVVIPEGTFVEIKRIHPLQNSWVTFLAEAEGCASREVWVRIENLDIPVEPLRHRLTKIFK